MKKIEIIDQISKSDDPIIRNIEKIKDLFPQVVSEGKIDFHHLSELLGNEINEDSEEFYRFTWMGKTKSRLESHKPTTGTLRPNYENRLNWGETENIYIEGDNLEVLKILQKSYSSN